MMKFSVIVPTYNSEKYITELLNSLAKQDFPKTEFEVVVVDDCSTDQTLQIVEKYRNKLNLKVSQLETNSGGPGKPRNVALKQAEGEFVLFVDSDDYINKETLKDAAAFIDEHHSDVLLIKMKGVNGRGVPQSMFKETAPEVTLLNSRIIYTLSPTKIYRTALLKDNDIYFPEELKSAEDQLFTMKAYLNANRISVLSDKAYYYATKREGEHMSSAYVSPEDFYEVMRLIAVEILNADLEEAHKNEILSHVGAGSDHHIPTNEILTSLSKDVLKSGKLKEVHTKEEIGCSHPNCPLRAAIVIPLEMHGSIVGTLKMYFTNPNDLTFVERQLAEGLANIFSSQIELGEAETQSKLLKDAEIKSLQAQVSPHFFFNSINTISALVRINSEKARELLLELSYFFRANLQGSKQHTITLDKELSQVRAYLSLEQARYPGRFNININVEDKYRDVLVPPFLIQILVENAIKHAFTNRKQGNDIDVSVIKETATHVRIIVQDNGQGISKDKMHLLGETSVESESGTGSALENLNLRLKGLFGKSAALQFESTSSGTTFWCVLPYERQEEE